MQDAALAFLVFCIGLQLVGCFLHPESPPDETYLGLTYEATDFSPEQEYDYIIVGGGTAGCPLAATLSEKYSVLLLERDSPAQNFISEDGVLNTRGRVLGGIEWDTSAVERAYEWVEDSIVTRPNQLGRWQASTLNALLESGVDPANGFTLDHLQGTKISGSTFDDSGRRHGAVELLNKANPENLKVVVHATVDRIIFSTSKSLAATGVTYHDSKGTNHEVHVRKNGEVILSAGALGSPQLLLVSGLGPVSYLSSLNIPVVSDHPFVGQFMADNPRTGVNLLVPVVLPDVGVRVVGISKSGPYIESSVVPRLTTSINFIPFLGSLPPLINLSIVIIGGKVTRPLSTGSLHLISPFDVDVSPSVRFNYYSHTEDILQCGNAVEVLRNFLQTRTMEEYKFSDIFGGKDFKYLGPSLPEDPTDMDSIATFCRESLSTFWHIHGGCLVNKVVDSHLKVIGVDSLRVVDASTFFNSPGTNPQATLMMLGRYIGVNILNERAANDIHS
ncbi:unnamed protein product [Lactuca saligna]|uniref:Glucose-methanol-choline oxidoreductase N-terminal domain-containing protein n=1 Tax=Lactuca saligna TaxID=75948 RepID=A0AA35ZK23_LACSI|nr:unnamed protein product [Lactuca saligna]